MAPEQFFVTIDEEYITLTQLLKALAIIQTGGQAKPFLQAHTVWVDGEVDQRRGRKLYPGMHIEIETIAGEFIIEEAAAAEADDDEA